MTSEITNHVIASEELQKLKREMRDTLKQFEVRAETITKSPLVHVPSVHYRLAQIVSASKAVHAILA